jgi:mono/diheme cytochrome c family protein
MNSPTNQPATSAPLNDSAAKDSAVPIWLIVVLFLLVYWGAVYFDEHGGWFDSQVYTPYVSAEQLKDFQVSGGENPFERGRKLYTSTCFVCHGPNGLGAPGTFPPLAGSDWVNEPQPGRMIRIVLQGFSGPGLKVNGQPFNTGSAMVPWASALSDDDIAAIITYVRGNKEWGNHAGPVTPEQVHAIRDKVKSHPLSFTPDEVEKISPAE